MKIMVFLHGTVIMHKSAVGRQREERVRQILDRRDQAIYDFGSYIPVDDAVRKLQAWGQQGAEIVYLSSHTAVELVEMDRDVLCRHRFPEGRIFFRQLGEHYADVVEGVLPDILIEDDCESIGGQEEMAYPHIRAELQARIQSVVVKEFGGIDHLPDDITALINLAPTQPEMCAAQEHLQGVALNDLDRLEATVNRFCQFIATRPASALADQPWGPKEVLAHLVYYHELYLRLLEASLTGRPEQPPRGRFSDLNAAAVTQSRGVPPDELVHRFQQANVRLMELYQEHDPRGITLEIKAGAKLRTLAELVPEVEAHIRNHLEKLRKNPRYVPDCGARQKNDAETVSDGRERDL